KHEKVYTLLLRVLDGKGGYDPGKLSMQKEFVLNEADSRLFETLLRDSGFLQMPCREQSKIMGLDGEVSVLEGVAGGRYHVIARWCAGSVQTDERKLRGLVKVYEFLMSKAGMEMDDAK